MRCSRVTVLRFLAAVTSAACWANVSIRVTTAAVRHAMDSGVRRVARGTALSCCSRAWIVSRISGVGVLVGGVGFGLGLGFEIEFKLGLRLGYEVKFGFEFEFRVGLGLGSKVGFGLKLNFVFEFRLGIGCRFEFRFGFVSDRGRRFSETSSIESGSKELERETESGVQLCEIFVVE